MLSLGTQTTCRDGVRSGLCSLLYRSTKFVTLKLDVVNRAAVRVPNLYKVHNFPSSEMENYALLLYSVSMRKMLTKSVPPKGFTLQTC